jgi:lipopolysaccharide export LptBFGC system permease protein LptF
MRDLRETPQTFMAEIKDPEYLSAREMLHYLRSKKEISSNTRARLLVDFHSRIAVPFACLIVTLIGVPVGAHTGRRGAFAGIMVAMTLFFGFYILQLTGQALGKQEIIPAFLGGWLPVIVFGAASPLFIHRMR